MKVADKEAIRKLSTPEELEIRRLVIEECIATLIPFAFTSFECRTLRRLMRTKSGETL